MTRDIRAELVEETRRWVALSKRSHETGMWERRGFEDFDVQVQATALRARAFAEMCESEQRVMRLVAELDASEREAAL